VRVRFYKSRNGWRWTIYAKNGKKVANAGQGYSRRIDAVRGFTSVTSITASGYDQSGGPFWTVEGL
jgi:uncharacterized protein YegP (UPF0339 family)